MSFAAVGRAIVSIFTLITFIAMIVLVVWTFVAHKPVLLAVTAALIAAAATRFIYNDYLHYFKHKD